MDKLYPTWPTQPIRLPIPFLPLPSIAAACIAAALCCALMCWGMFLIPKRWPFKFLEPVFPAGSLVWMALAVLLSLAGWLGTWRLAHLSDLATALAWDLASTLLLVLRARTRRSAPTHLLRANTPGRITRKE
jgi:hypothetical protein